MDEKIEKPNIKCEHINENDNTASLSSNRLSARYAHPLGTFTAQSTLELSSRRRSHKHKIDGVLHEISTVPGVKEDVTEIVLNVKGIIAKLHSDGPKDRHTDYAGGGLLPQEI